MPVLTSLPPLSLYIHIPWCVRKCPYCDFNSHQMRADLQEEAYVTCLLNDLAQDIASLEKRSLDSIFFGGGTPSLFSAAAIERILSGVHQQLSFSPSIEITLEANPGTVELQRFRDFRSAGVNRLSIGIQSFQNDKLTRLGRIHDSDTAQRAVASAHAANFDTFNIDLMYGLPEQSLDDALHDLQTAVSLAPPHLSWYHLTIEPHTPFYRQPPALPDDDAIIDIQDHGRAFLAQHGFVQYEISAYSQPDHHCRHNMNYWTFGDYLGIGAGAHGKISHLQQQTITRTWKQKHPRDYLAAETGFIAGSTNCTTEDLIFEFMMNALRLYQPIPFQWFEQRTGLSIELLQAPLQIAVKKGLLSVTDQTITLTELGQRFLNDVLTLFMPDQSQT